MKNWDEDESDGRCLWNNEQMVSDDRHKMIEEIGKKILSKSMRISTKKWQRHA